MKKRITVIYILGMGHSGSTLLDLILGSHSQIESVGELFQLPDYMSVHSTRSYERQYCTCGVHFSKCSYWNQVQQKLKSKDAELYKAMISENHLGLNYDFTYQNYCLLSSILEVSSKNIICDSSKVEKRLINYLQSDLFDVWIIHLIRDVRAVSYSLSMKKKRIIEQVGENNYKQVINQWKKQDNTYNLNRAARQWNTQNISYWNQFKDYSQYIILKYEDLCNKPTLEITTILNKLNLNLETNQLNFSSFTHHNISGNRMKSQKHQKIKVNDKYIDALSFQNWWLSTLIALPSIKQFGYPLLRSGHK